MSRLVPSPTYYTLELGPVRLVVMNAEDEGDAQFKYMLQLLQDVSHARQTHGCVCAVVDSECGRRRDTSVASCPGSLLP